MEALDEKIERTKGWGYKMKSFVKKLQDNNIFQSMSPRRKCLDNSPIENFFSLMKQEMYQGKIHRKFEKINKAVKE